MNLLSPFRSRGRVAFLAVAPVALLLFFAVVFHATGWSGYVPSPAGGYSRVLQDAS